MAYAKVRKRTWQTKDGEQTAWVADYFDQDGKRRLKTFTRQKDAKDWLDAIKPKIKEGTHVPDTVSPTLLEAIDAWIKRGEAHSLEASTMRQRELHKAIMIGDEDRRGLLDGGTKLSRYSPARLEMFRDDLLRQHSPAMARKVIVSLRSVLRQAKATALLNADLKVTVGGRHKKPLKVGVDIPTVPEVKATVEAAADDAKGRALVCLAAFAGLRASELRGLGWAHLDLGRHPKVTIEERADEDGTIGPPKSEAAHREIGLNETTARALKAWKLAQPPVRYTENGEKRQRPHVLVFGTGADRPERLSNVHRRQLAPLLKRAGVKHYGLHSFRHFAISSWLKTCNGDFKAVQTRAGHATLALTLDRYGHLLDKNDSDQIAAAEKLVLG